MNIRVRSIDGVRAASLTPSESDLALLAGPDYAGQPVEASEVNVRGMLLCHDQYDRTFEKFPRAYLDRFAVTLPGKSVLIGHDKDREPVGRFFRAGIDPRREDFPTLINGKALEEDETGEKAEIVPGFAPRRRSVNYLNAGFYFPNDPEAAGLKNRIDLGVYKSTSIGFRFDDLNCDVCRKSYIRSDCPHILGQRLEEKDGLIVTGTYAGDPEQAEALEGSIVYLGAQPGARLIKSMIERGEVDPERLAWTEFGQDLVALKEAESLARRYGHQQKSWHFPHSGGNAPFSFPVGEVEPSPVGDDPPPSVDGKDAQPAPIGAQEKEHMKNLLKALGLAEDATEDAALAALKAVQDSAAATDSAKSAEQAATAAKTEAEKSLNDLKPLAEVGEKALTDLKDTYLAHCLRLGDGDAELAEKTALAEGWVAQRAYDRLKQMVDGKFKAVCEKFPASPSGDPAPLDQREEPKRKPGARAYQLA